MASVAPRRAFTLVELLVVIAVIGILIALLLPAVQAAREAARRSACQSNVRQLGLGAQLHHETHRAFPTGGWGFVWTGDPDRGYGADQPGGWLYNLLPFVEGQAIRDLGSGASDADKLVAAREAVQVPIALASCPSRRAPGLTPYTSTMAIVNAEPAESTFKADYAASAGDLVTNNRGPDSLEALETHPWGNTADATGLMFTRSEVTLAQVTDGASHTFALGEKRCQLNEHDWGDDQHAFVGHGTDVARFTAASYLNFQGVEAAIVFGADSEESQSRAFGSVHPTGCNFAMADGSARFVTYDIDPEVHRRNGNRADGESAPDAE